MQNLGRIDCIDMEEKCDKIVTGSHNGTIALWSIKLKQLVKVINRDDHAIEHILFVTKDKHERAIVVTSKPEIAVYDIKDGLKKSINWPRGLGLCIKVQLERHQELMVATFLSMKDRGEGHHILGVFNVKTCQFLHTIDSVDFSNAYIDESCTYFVKPDV